jgi:glycosyltransferase involved in cell wall biosynthesis
MKGKSVVLFFFPNYSTFVERDGKLMSAKFDVKSFAFNSANKYYIPFSFIRQFFFLCFHIFHTRIIVCQIAAWHSVLPVVFARLFGKPSIIFLAGTDCAYFPSLRYGNFCKPLLARATAFSVRKATCIAPKHQSLIRAPYTYHPSGQPEQGIACFVKNLKTPYVVIPNGFDSNRFKPMQQIRSHNSFITVAAGMGTDNINQLKGVDLILEVAPHLPHCTFTLVGMAPQARIKNLPANVIVLPEQNQEQLCQLYNEHRFYLQLSLSEGFPNAVCEAMLCGCVPVVSNVNALPDIADHAGFVLQQHAVSELRDVISKALAADWDALSQKARNHIIANYSMEQRLNKLFDLFEAVSK